MRQHTIRCLLGRHEWGHWATFEVWRDNLPGNQLGLHSFTTAMLRRCSRCGRLDIRTPHV